MLGGVAGLIANLALLLFYVLALRNVGGLGWTGPLSDLAGSVSAAAIVVVVVALTALHRPTAVLQAAAGLATAGMAWIAGMGLVSMVGDVPVPVQYVSGGLAYGALFAWMLLLGRRARRMGSPTARVARWARVLGLVMLVSVLAMAIGLALPDGPSRMAAVYAAMAPAVAAYLALPFWLIALARGGVRTEGSSIRTATLPGLSEAA
jgi:hypothetical protein